MCLRIDNIHRCGNVLVKVLDFPTLLEQHMQEEIDKATRAEDNADAKIDERENLEISHLTIPHRA